MKLLILLMLFLKYFLLYRNRVDFIEIKVILIREIDMENFILILLNIISELKEAYL